MRLQTNCCKVNETGIYHAHKHIVGDSQALAFSSTIKLLFSKYIIIVALKQKKMNERKKNTTERCGKNDAATIAANDLCIPEIISLSIKFYAHTDIVCWCFALFFLGALA